MTTPCPCCRGSGNRPFNPMAQACPVCGGSGASPYAPTPSAVTGHWAYLLGIQARANGARANDSPYERHSEADRAWRMGWAAVERDLVAEHYHEKIRNEGAPTHGW